MHTAISPPTFASTDRTVNESTDVTVFCTSSARPTPHMFQWTYEGRVLSSNAELQLNNVQRNQTGVYTCTTTNVVGTASANITLTVQCEWKGREGRGTYGGEGKVECGLSKWYTQGMPYVYVHVYVTTIKS